MGTAGSALNRPLVIDAIDVRRQIWQPSRRGLQLSGSGTPSRATQRSAAVKRGIVIGVAAAAMVVAVGAGCSSNKSNSGASSAASSAAGPQVIVDGQKQNVSGQVTCTAAGDNTNIGIGDAASGVGAVVSNANPPIVHAVGLGSVNGVTLGFSDAAPNQAANAGAAVSGKSYAIKGTATGVDMSNPQQPQQVTKSFELNVTCP
jgi:lipoprotein LpqH